MHMISKKDLSDAEMDILTKSCSPTIVITAKGEVQTNEEATVLSQRIGYILDNESPRGYASSFIAREGFSMNTDILMNGSTVKNHLSKKKKKRYLDTMQHGELRSDRGSRLVNEFFLRFLSFNFNDTFKTGEASFYIFLKLVFFSNYSNNKWQWSCVNETREREDQSAIDSPPVPVSSSNVDDRTGKPVVCREPNHEPIHQANQKFPKRISKKRRPWQNGETRCLPRQVVHRQVLKSRSSLEPTHSRNVDLGKHSVYNHFTKDRNCEIRQRTKNYKGPVQKAQWRSRTSCRKFWWFENCRSQSSQWKFWISKQSSICSRGAGRGHPMDSVVSVHNKKLLRKHKGACKSSWSRWGSLKSFILTIPWNSAKPVKIFPGIIARLHHTDRKTHGIA